MNYSYKKTAAAILTVTALLSALLIIVAIRSDKSVEEYYTLKEYNGSVALYNGEKMIDIFEGIVLSNLPDGDRKKFANGIKTDSLEEALSIIEDFDG